MLTFRRALVTGASYGIGEAFARELAVRGSGLVLVARSGDTLRSLADGLTATHGIEVEVLAADLATDEGLDAVAARLRARERPVDLLVNNAGIGTSGDLATLDPDREEVEIRVNVVAVTTLTHAVLPRLLAEGRGGVLNLSSIAAYQPLATLATYGATKAFVSSFTEALHEEVRGSGVHVTALCPGLTRTGFQVAADADVAASRVPAPAWQTPAEVARAGIDAVAAGRAVAVPGAVNKAAVTIATLSPSAITRRVLRRTLRAIS